MTEDLREHILEHAARMKKMREEFMEHWNRYLKVPAMDAAWEQWKRNAKEIAERSRTAQGNGQ